MRTAKARMNVVRRLVLAAVLASASTVAWAQPSAPLPAGVTRATSVEGITEYRLANGLRVLLFPDPTKANITVNCTYMVGSRHEDYGETGMAHLLEHLMFKGSKNHPNIPKELQDHGTRPNGSTWYDRTNYFETFTASDENLEWALSMEADRMVNAFVSRKDLDSEMTVVRNEFEAGENDPQGVLEERVMSTAFLWHNYGKSTIGARSDIERVPIERLQAFYKHFYQPDNAVLVVAGKFEAPKTLAMVQKHFGPLPKPDRTLRRTYTAEPVQDGERTVTLRRAGETQAIAIAWHIPAGSSSDFTAIHMAMRILGDTPSGRLYKAVVETKKAATVSADSYQLAEPGLAMVNATVRKEQDLDDARRTILATIDELKTKPFTQEELDRQKAAAARQFSVLMNNTDRVALYLSEWQARGDWRLIFLDRDRTEGVALADVQKAAEKYLIASNRTVGLFIPDNAPVRAEVPDAPDVAAMVKDYKGRAEVSQGEAFDASPANIDKRTVRGELGSGLRLAFLSKRTRGGQVVASISFHFGDEKNLAGKRFVGQLAGGMLMRGTARHTRQQVKDEFDKLKAQVSVSGTASGASISITTTRENFPAVLALAAEALKESNFPADEFEQLKQQQLAMLERMKTEPQMIAMVEIQRHMTPYPPSDVRYTPTADEQIEGIKAVTLDQVKQFYQQFYGLGAGEAVLVGDVDTEAAQKQLAGLFNGWKSGQSYARIRRLYKKVAPASRAFETPDKANAMFLAGLPVQMKDTDPDYPALVLGNYILGSGLNSRLFARIRGKEGLSYGVGSQFVTSGEDDLSLFLANAIANPPNTPKVEASFKDEMAKILREGYTEAEVEAAKKSWLDGRAVSRANDSELASRISNQRYLGRTMAFDADLEAKVLRLTPAEIQAAMKRHLDPEQMSYFKAGDFKKAGVAW